jgi:flagellar hook-basal body complex protein FliE
MIDPLANISSASTGPGAIQPGVSPASTGTEGATGATGSGGFIEFLNRSVGEVSQMQQDASQAVQDLATGRTDDVSGVMVAVEKGDVAFKTLLAVRAKLMEAYNEIKSMQM